MNIVINAVFAHENPRGPGKYTNNLLRGFADLDKENQYYIYYGKWMKGYSFLKIKQHNFHFIELDIKNSQVIRNLYLALILPFKCKKYKPERFLLLDTQAVFVKPCKIMSTIYDLAEFEIPEKYSKIQALFRRNIVKIQVKLSDCIFTVSEYSRKSICERFHLPESKVKVTYTMFELPIVQNTEEPEPFFLFVGEVERAKNLSVLIRAFSLLSPEDKKKYQIRVVGKKGNDYEASLKLAEELGVLDRIRFYGYLADKELAELYSRCYVFVFPSLFEGFGIPVLEAMALGAPVICSNAASIPEIGGTAVLLFDPRDDRMLKEQLEKILNNKTLRQKLIFMGRGQVKKFQENSGVKKTYEVVLDEKGMKDE